VRCGRCGCRRVTTGRVAWLKTDRRDAERLARLLRLGEITPVRIPTLEEEAARDLVRAREDARGDLMRARHRLSKLLLRQF
jgi:transposase